MLQGGLDILKEMEESANAGGDSLKVQMGINDAQPASITEVRVMSIFWFGWTVFIDGQDLNWE